jgi:RND family efflux transporter MFP subunit
MIFIIFFRTVIRHQRGAVRPTLSALITTAVALSITACDNPKTEEQRVTPVLVMTAGTHRPSTARTLPGFITPRYSADVGFQVAGRIQNRHVDVGTRVSQGQTLLVLNTDDYTQGLLAAEDQVVAAKADMEQSAAETKRLRALIDGGAIGQSAMDRQQALADTAKALLDQAYRRLEIARNRLEHATLVAPFDGVITGIYTEIGQVVDEGMPVLTLANDQILEVSVDIPEDLAQIADLPKNRFSGRLMARPDVPLELRLREFSPVTSLPLRTFKAIFTIQNIETIGPTPKLGMTAEVILSQYAKTGDQTNLPAAALVSTGEHVSVWVVAPDQETLRERVVTVKRITDDGAVVAGLQEGEQVVIAGTDKLTSGMIVRPIERTATAYEAVKN